jgi:hypothetical protein
MVGDIVGEARTAVDIPFDRVRSNLRRQSTTEE